MDHRLVTLVVSIAEDETDSRAPWYSMHGGRVAHMSTKKHSKITAEPIATFHGFTIYADLQKAKRTGKDRVWFQIRQDNPKKYRTAICLNYPHALDVQFQSENGGKTQLGKERL